MSSALYVNNIYKTADLFEKLAKSTNKEFKEEMNIKNAGVGHFILDVVGLIPGVGEVADMTNALIYLDEGEYLMAGLSLISVIPEIGDFIGKGTKLALWLKNLGKVGEFLSKFGGGIVKIASLIKKYMPKIKIVLDVARKNKTINEYFEKINKAIEDFVEMAESDKESEEESKAQFNAEFDAEFEEES